MKHVLFLLTFLVMTSLVQAQVGNPNVSVYPNPSNGKDLRIEITDDQIQSPAQVSIYSPLGELMFNQTYTLYDGRREVILISLPERLEKGIYMLSVKTGTAQVTKRLMVRN